MTQTIDAKTAVSWINTLTALGPILTRVRRGEAVTWEEAFTAGLRVDTMCAELLVHTVAEVAIETAPAVVALEAA